MCVCGVAGVYTRTNLNLPRVMVKRKNFKDFQRDSPLTETGRSQARLTGEPVYVCLEKGEVGGGGGEMGMGLLKR